MITDGKEDNPIKEKEIQELENDQNPSFSPKEARISVAAKERNPSPSYAGIGEVANK